MPDWLIKALAWVFYVTAGLAGLCHLITLGGLIAYALGVGR